MPTNEAQVVAAIVAAIRRRWPTAWVVKIHGGPQQRAGLPDLLVCLQGHLIGLEVKYQRPGESRAHALGRATLLQRAELLRIERAGGTGAVVLSPEEALEVLAACL